MSVPLLPGAWLNKDPALSCAAYTKKADVDDISTVDLTDFPVDPSLAHLDPCVYQYCVKRDEKNKQPYNTVVDTEIARVTDKFIKEKDKRRKTILRCTINYFKHLKAVSEQSAGPFLYYLGCSSDILQRYDGRRFEAGSALHIFHRDHPDPSFTFSFGVLAAAPASDLLSTNMQTMYAMERELGVEARVTKEAIAAKRLINRQPLGRAWGVFGEIIGDPVELEYCTRLYYSAQPNHMLSTLVTHLNIVLNLNLASNDVNAKSFVKNHINPLFDNNTLNPPVLTYEDQLMANVERVIDHGWIPCKGRQRGPLGSSLISHIRAEFTEKDEEDQDKLQADIEAMLQTSQPARRAKVMALYHKKQPRVEDMFAKQGKRKADEVEEEDEDEDEEQDEDVEVANKRKR